MNQLNQAISSAIRVRAVREGKTLTAIAKDSGIKTTSFFDRMTNKRCWDIEQLESLALALGLKSSFDLFELAEHEAELAETERRLVSVPTEVAA